MQYKLSRHKQTDDKDISFQLISYEMLKNKIQTNICLNVIFHVCQCRYEHLNLIILGNTSLQSFSDLVIMEGKIC